MGRNTKELNELVNKRVFKYLLERQSAAARLKAVRTVTERLLKTRSSNGDRKKLYKDQLDNAHKVLCCLATDGEELLEKHKKLKSDYDQVIKSRSEVSDMNVALHEKLRKMNYIIATSETQKELRFKAEEDCGRFLQEKRKALDESARLKEENRALRKELQLIKINKKKV